MRDIVLDIQYWSQYLDIQDGKNAPRSCGVTCVKMILDFHGLDENSNLEALVEKGFAEGGFGPNGWVHDYFVKLLVSYGLTGSYRMEKMNEGKDLEEIAKSIESGILPIVSVERRLFDSRSFHMVCLSGTRRDQQGNLLGFFYTDPAKLDRKSGINIFVTKDTFLSFWRKMAIFPKV